MVYLKDRLTAYQLTFKPAMRPTQTPPSSGMTWMDDDTGQAPGNPKPSRCRLRVRYSLAVSAAARASRIAARAATSVP